MNGAHLLMRTLLLNGVDTCFMNPGTSEMQFVAALDGVPEMRSVLSLFEGGATGAADGYARMRGRPAATLLHLGPGTANGLANLHNARRAGSPVVNIVGDHATYHQAFDAPLQSNIALLARWTEGWFKEVARVEDLFAYTSEAVTSALGLPSKVATLAIPADLTWSEAGELPEGAGSATAAERACAPVDSDLVEASAKALVTGRRTALLVGGGATSRRALLAASRVAGATGAKLLCETFPPRLTRGAGIPAVERLAYLAEFSSAQLEGLEHMVLVGTKAPVAFFAYPGKPSSLVPDGCELHELCAMGVDPETALEALADEVRAPRDAATVQPAFRPEVPSGPLNAQSAAQAIGALLPDGAVVSDESNTAGLFVSGATAGVGPHDWLCLTGGAIGQGMPLATGAAVAEPDRKVVNLQADGSAMYTLQSLWTQAREGLDVTTVIFDNGSYAVLEMELSRVGAAGAGPRAHAMLDLGAPNLDFVSLAKGLGVPARRATTADELVEQFRAALHEPGPAVVVAAVGRLQ